MKNMIKQSKLVIRDFLNKLSLLWMYDFVSLLKLKFLALSAVLMDNNKAELAARPTYSKDGFATSHHVEFLEDGRFISSFNNSFEGVPKELQPMLRNIDWRAHICTWAATRALALKDGDFVECGVWYGVLSKVICEYTNFSQKDRKFFLVDVWGGIDVHEKWYLSDIFDVVTKRFEDYSNVKLIRGFIPDILPTINTQKVAYLSIDMNGSHAERAALEYFYEKMVPGGVIYFDDYGWGFPDLRRKVNEFFADKPETLLHFPAGVSIVIKH
jgi:O-methyltransferase